jgi:hypothetical protein
VTIPPRSGAQNWPGRPVGRVLCRGVADLGGCSRHAVGHAAEISAVLNACGMISWRCAPTSGRKPLRSADTRNIYPCRTGTRSMPSSLAIVHRWALLLSPKHWSA